MAILPQYLSIFPKDNANRGQNKMNEFIFYAKVQLIFAFRAKIIQSTLSTTIRPAIPQQNVPHPYR